MTEINPLDAIGEHLNQLIGLAERRMAADDDDDEADMAVIEAAEMSFVVIDQFLQEWQARLADHAATPKAMATYRRLQEGRQLLQRALQELKG